MEASFQLSVELFLNRERLYFSSPELSGWREICVAVSPETNNSTCSATEKISLSSPSCFPTKEPHQMGGLSLRTERWSS